MADQFYDNIPARANNIGTAVDQIEYTLGWIKDVFQTICSWSDDSLTNIVVGNRGAIPLRSRLIYKDADEIYLNPGAYHHAGTTDQMVYWASQLTFQFGSGGSNVGSEDLDAGVQEIQYLYIDDSVLVADGTNVITAARLLNSNEAPAWDAAQYGWYPSSSGTYVQTSDRCIGAVLINASNQVVEFFHEGDLVHLADEISLYSATPTGATWTDVTCVSPVFSTKAMVGMHIANSNVRTFHWRVNGQSGSTGHQVLETASGATHDSCSTIVHTDGSQIFEIYANDSGVVTEVWQNGWFLPIGI